MRRATSIPAIATAIALGILGCKGAEGPVGPKGDLGTPGNPGQQGPRGCVGLAPGETRGLTGEVTLSAPSNGQFFAPGERPVATIRFADECGALRASELGTAQLFLHGPRSTTKTRTATKLLNCVVDRNASDRQHHYVNLRAPRFLEPAQQNLAEDADGTITFTFAAVSDEGAGTYEVAVWAKSLDERDQVFQRAELQLGTATHEELPSGPAAASRCLDCHGVPSTGRASMHHVHPSAASEVGNWALDLFPVATCQACHNLDGYSLNATVRKVHGLHRGKNQLAAGVAHPEYGLPADSTLLEYLDVGFPAMPSGERDCATCHADDRWSSRPSRVACGTCHDNLFFDTGTLSPPRVFGRPSGIACTNDLSCAGFGMWSACNMGTGDCERRTHPVELDDTQCAVCHVDGGVSPISDRHEIIQRTLVRDLQLKDVVLYAFDVDLATSCVPGGAPKACGNGPGGAIRIRNADGSQPGDVLRVRFTLTTGDGASVTNLRTASALSATLILAGPSEDPQRAFGPITMKSSGTFTCPAGETAPGNRQCVGGVYDYALPKQHSSSSAATGEFPHLALAPYNTVPGTPAGTPDPTRPNAAGTYTLWLYVNEAFSTPASFRDAANVLLPFRAGTAGPVLPREVIRKDACNSCHSMIQAHGGGRQDEAGACSMCHSRGATDRQILTTGSACSSDADCGLHAYGFEECLPAPLPITLPLPDPMPDPAVVGTPNTCVLVADPTPGQAIDMAVMAHQIHYARLLGGYASRNYPILPGKLHYVANTNRIVDMSEMLAPVDVRNCRVCHKDSGRACSAANPCGVGQECSGGKCVNRSWTRPSARVCLSCHDSEATFGHAALQTFGGIETCDVCHAPGDVASVERAHEVVSPYVPPYPRERQ